MGGGASLKNLTASENTYIQNTINLTGQKISMLRSSVFGTARATFEVIVKVMLAILGILVGSVAAYGTVLAFADSYIVTLGQYRFSIPKQYSRQSAIPQWLLRLSGLDDGSRTYTLEFPAEEIAAVVPRFKELDGAYKENVRAILTALTSEEVRRYQKAETHRDLWYSQNFYHQSTIEPYSDQPWFRVYGKYEYGRLWAVVKQAPQKDVEFPHKLFDFWVANCVQGASPITQSGEIVTCQSYVFYDDIVIDFYISENNLQVIDDVREFIKSKVNSWRAQDT